MMKAKKREIVCPHMDCIHFSCEHVQVDNEWEQITYCSHPNNDLIINGKSCNFYKVDWMKQLKKVRRQNPVERVRTERLALLRLMQLAIGKLSEEERDALLGLVEQLKQQEERLGKLHEIQNELDQLGEIDPFVIGAPDPPTMPSAPLPEVVEEKPVEPVYIPTTEPNSNSEENHDVASIAPMEENETFKEGSPEAIVKKFIESWNQQKFRDEFDCLAKRLRGTPRKEYILSRQYAYADAVKRGSNGNMPTQEIGELYSVKLERDTARIICEKIENTGKFTKRYQQKYSLQKENDEWKITAVQTREM